MAASSSQNVGSSTLLHMHNEANQELTPVFACSIPKNELEVLCELMVDFDNIEEHQFHLTEDIIFQGWTSLFAEFVGPVYPDLVKEFWAHAVVAPKAILSFVHGKFIVITENILRVMFDLKNPEGAFEFDQRADLGDVLSTLYPNVKKTKSVKDLRDVYKIWTKILLGCFYHRKGTYAADFINNDQRYILYCIATKKKVDAIYIIFNHLWKAVKDSRNPFRREKGGTIIPFGRIITNLLVHSKIVESLESEGIIKDLAVTSGASLNAFSLKKMKIIDTILKVPQPLVGTRIRRKPVLADFETFFNSEESEVRTKYLKSQREDKSLKDQDKGAPIKVNRKKGERTKRKFDHPSINQVKVVKKAAATTKKEMVPEEVIAKVVKAVSVDFEKNKKEAEKKKKKKKSNNNDEIVEVAEKKITRKRKMIIQSSDEENVSQEAENQPEVLAYVRRKEISSGKAKIIEEPKSKKQKKTEDLAKALLRGSKGICISEHNSVPAVRSKVAPIEVVPSSGPEKASSESPVFVHVLTPPSSPITIPPSPPTINHVLNIPPLQTIFPSQPSPNATFEHTPSTSQNNLCDSPFPTSASHEQLLRDCNYTPKPHPEAEVVVLDSDTEAESSYRLDREPHPYFTSNPAFSKTQIKFRPVYPIGAVFEKIKRNLRSIFDTLKIAESSGLNDVAMRNFWRIFRRKSDALFLELQEACIEVAPRPHGILRNYEDFWFVRLRGRHLLEEKPFLDEMDQLKLAAEMEANSCRDMVIWIPDYPVLLGDFKTLFDFLRENPSEKDPSLVIPEVVDPPEVEGPSAPRNLAAILQALENGDSEIPAAEYGDASMQDADAEYHVAESDPVEEIPANDLSMEATDQVAIPVVESGEASSDESSRLARTLEEIQKRQDEQSSLNAEYRAFMVKQDGHNNEVQEMLAKILSRLGPS